MSLDPPPAAAGGRELAAAIGRDLAAAAVVSLAAISFYVSAATLLFQGELALQVPAAIGATLFGGALLAAIGAWRGALPLASTGPEPATVPVLAAITAGVAVDVSGAALLPTVLMALMLTGLAIGVLWWVAGRRGWGELMRYIPYPVIGGFLGSIGWLMFTGGLGVSMGESFSPARAWAWLHGAADWRLAAGLALGVLIWRVTLRFTHPLTLPSVLLVGVLAVHAALAAAGLDLDAARDGGWLLAPFRRTEPVLAWSPALLAQVRWDAIAAQLPLIASAVIVATIGLLLSDTSLEVAWDEDADINRDLRALGQGNLVTVAFGGLVGGVSISRSVLNKAAGAVSRRSSVFKAAFCLAAMLGGGPAIALVPRPLLGGVLVYLGLGMLKTWLLDSRNKLPRQEYAIVASMVALTATLGFLPAVCVGVLACCVDFAAKSARLAPVRRMLARSAWPAKAERSAAHTTLLQREGTGLRIVELQGVLFFGSTTLLARQVEPLFAGDAECLLFDFKHVRGLDTSAGQSFARLFKAARRHGLRVELSGLAPSLRGALQASGALAGVAREHAELDAAVAAWDDAVLVRADAAPDDGVPPGMPTQLREHFEPRTLEKGRQLFAQGDASDALYLVRSGRVAIVAPGASGHVLLRTVHAGSVIGEMGLFRGAPRSASACAVDDVELLVLTRERFERLVRDDPAFEAALYRMFLVQMAGRVEQLGMQASALAG
jgi:SulP family sulfate permease